MNFSYFAPYCWLIVTLMREAGAWPDARIDSRNTLREGALLRFRRQSVLPTDLVNSSDTYRLAFAACKSSPTAPNCSHYCEAVVSPAGSLMPLCRCYEGFRLAADGSCTKDQALRKQCNVSNGACSERCANNKCQCSEGLSVTTGGYCKDVDECSQDSSVCSRLGKRCINLYVTYTCAASDIETSAAVPVAGIYNEQRLLNSRLLTGLAAWIGVLLLIIGALLITFCCLPPVMPSPEFFKVVLNQ